MHVIHRLYQSEFDFAEYHQPSRSYMIATIPRSGSTYFGIELWRTGLLGAPMEYLNLTTAAELMQRLGFDTPTAYEMEESEILQYWRRIKYLRTSPNGVFGYKMFMIAFRDLLAIYPALFKEIQPDYVLYLTRRDLIGQAISYSRAKQTKTWFADVPDAPDARYEPAHILQCKKEIELQCFYWENVFAQAEIEPIRVMYEDLLDDRDRCVERILGEMGMRPDPSAALSIPLIRRQADEITDTWRARFSEDCQE